MSNKTVLVLSGGMDSTTLLYRLLKEGRAVEAISFDYGQRHKKELEYAAKVCKKLDVKHQIIDISNLNSLLQGSSLTSEDVEVPEGHYEDETMKATVVPNRNMIMLSIAAGYAISIKAESLAIAVHAGDHTIYPDCRPEFINNFQKTVWAGNYHQTYIESPYINKTKGHIAKEGLELGINYDEDTWSCYKGLDKPCEKCGTCVERLEALNEAKNKLG